MTATPRIDRLLAEHAALAILAPNVVRLPVAGIEMDTPLIAPNPAGMDLLKELTGELRGVREDVSAVKVALATLNGQELSVRLAQAQAMVAQGQLDMVGLGARIVALEAAAKKSDWRTGEVFKAVLPLLFAALGAAAVWLIRAR